MKEARFVWCAVKRLDPKRIRRSIALLLCFVLAGAAIRLAAGSRLAPGARRPSQAMRSFRAGFAFARIEQGRVLPLRTSLVRSWATAAPGRLCIRPEFSSTRALSSLRFPRAIFIRSQRTGRSPPSSF